MTSFTPREIVSELDRFIVGQDSAKKAVAIALRNRWRRQQVKGSLQRRNSSKKYSYDRTYWSWKNRNCP